MKYFHLTAEIKQIKFFDRHQIIYPVINITARFPGSVSIIEARASAQQNLLLLDTAAFRLGTQQRRRLKVLASSGGCRHRMRQGNRR